MPPPPASDSLWICPKCGNRLVTRNMSHSCGTFRLEDLVPPPLLEVAQAYSAMLESLGDVVVIPQKTRLTCVGLVRFAGFYPRKGFLLANFAVPRRIENPRIVKFDDYGGRWKMHYVRLQSLVDIDEELRLWLAESYETVGAVRA